MADFTPIEWFSVVCLSIVAACVAVGIFYSNFRENWLQFVGLVGIAIWACARVSQLLDMMTTRLPVQGQMFHLSLALYALGTAYKVWQHRPSTPPPPPASAPREVGYDELHQVSGGQR